MALTALVVVVAVAESARRTAAPIDPPAMTGVGIGLLWGVLCGLVVVLIVPTSHAPPGGYPPGADRPTRSRPHPGAWALHHAGGTAPGIWTYEAPPSGRPPDRPLTSDESGGLTFVPRDVPGVQWKETPEVDDPVADLLRWYARELGRRTPTAPTDLPIPWYGRPRPWPRAERRQGVHRGVPWRVSRWTTARRARRTPRCGPVPHGRESAQPRLAR